MRGKVHQGGVRGLLTYTYAQPLIPRVWFSASRLASSARTTSSSARELQLPLFNPNTHLQATYVLSSILSMCSSSSVEHLELNAYLPALVAVARTPLRMHSLTLHP